MYKCPECEEIFEQDEHTFTKGVCVCGYADPNYFSRIFKKNTGLTPTEYKEGK